MYLQVTITVLVQEPSLSAVSATCLILPVSIYDEISKYLVYFLSPTHPPAIKESISLALIIIDTFCQYRFGRFSIIVFITYQSFYHRYNLFNQAVRMSHPCIKYYNRKPHKL